jgi:hypothetical protein
MCVLSVTHINHINKLIRFAEKQKEQAVQQGDLQTAVYFIDQIQNLKLQLIVLGGNQ